MKYWSMPKIYPSASLPVKPEPQSFRAVYPAMSDHHALAVAIHDLANAVRGASQHHSRPATKQDLIELEESLAMKISEAKSVLLNASNKQKEALQEIGKQVADLNVQIQELRDAAVDPNISDEEFNTLIATLQTDAQALADIVPGSVSDGSGQV